MPSDYDDAYVRDAVVNSPRALFDTRLTRLSAARDFVNLLRTDPPQHLHRAVPEALTVTETSFFRDPALFDTLHTTILPELIQARAHTRRLRLWSAATSTGQEAYSLAILLAGLIPQPSDWQIDILGSDISRQAIDYARRGHFRPQEVQRGLTPQLLAQHFTPQPDGFAIHPSLSTCCTFRTANLCAPPPPGPGFDLILLRNVLLYLTPGDRTLLLARMHRQLAPDGFLILGSSEQAEDSTTLFHPHQIGETYLYRPIP